MPSLSMPAWILLILFVAGSVTLDYTWGKRIWDLFADQRTARKICDECRDRGESYIFAKWRDLELHPRSKYVRRLEYVYLAEDPDLIVVEFLLLIAFVITEGVVIGSMLA